MKRLTELEPLTSFSSFFSRRSAFSGTVVAAVVFEVDATGDDLVAVTRPPFLLLAAAEAAVVAVPLLPPVGTGDV